MLKERFDFEKYEKQKNRGELIFYGTLVLLGLLTGIVAIICKPHSESKQEKLKQKTQESIVSITDSNILKYNNSINYFEF